MTKTPQRLVWPPVRNTGIRRLGRWYQRATPKARTGSAGLAYKYLLWLYRSESFASWRTHTGAYVIEPGTVASYFYSYVLVGMLADARVKFEAREAEPREAFLIKRAHRLIRYHRKHQVMPADLLEPGRWSEPWPH